MTSERRDEGTDDRQRDPRETRPPEVSRFDGREDDLVGKSDGDLLQRLEY